MRFFLTGAGFAAYFWMICSCGLAAQSPSLLTNCGIYLARADAHGIAEAYSKLLEYAAQNAASHSELTDLYLQLSKSPFEISKKGSWPVAMRDGFEKLGDLAQKLEAAKREQLDRMIEEKIRTKNGEAVTAAKEISNAKQEHGREIKPRKILSYSTSGTSPKVRGSLAAGITATSEIYVSQAKNAGLITAEKIVAVNPENPNDKPWRTFISQNGNLFATVTDIHKTIGLWNADTLELIGSIKHSDFIHVNDVQFTPSGKTVVIYYKRDLDRTTSTAPRLAELTIEVHSMGDDGKWVHRGTAKDKIDGNVSENSFKLFAFSDDRAVLSSGHMQTPTLLIDLKKIEIHGYVKATQKAAIWHQQCGTDGKLLRFMEDGRVESADLSLPYPVMNILKNGAPGNRLDDFASSPDGSVIMYRNNRKEIVVINSTTFAVLGQLKMPNGDWSDSAVSSKQSLAVIRVYDEKAKIQIFHFYNYAVSADPIATLPLKTGEAVRGFFFDEKESEFIYLTYDGTYAISTKGAESWIDAEF